MSVVYKQTCNQNIYTNKIKTIFNVGLIKKKRENKQVRKRKKGGGTIGIDERIYVPGSLDFKRKY